jgi:hypothetical protein
LQTNQELFVGREDVSAKIENYVVAINTPPLLLPIMRFVEWLEEIEHCYYSAN